MATVFGKVKWEKHSTFTPEGYLAAKANSYARQIEKDIFHLQEYEEAAPFTTHVVRDDRVNLNKAFDDTGVELLSYVDLGQTRRHRTQGSSHRQIGHRHRQRGALAAAWHPRLRGSSDICAQLSFPR